MHQGTPPKDCAEWKALLQQQHTRDTIAEDTITTGNPLAPFSLAARVNSFRFAFKGIVELVRHEHNAWIHLAATAAVIALGCLVSVSRTEWALLVFAISLVWLAEGMNTAIELLADAITEDRHPLIGRVKDIAAGAVLLSAIGAAIIGCLVFLPYLMNF